MEKAYGKDPRTSAFSDSEVTASVDFERAANAIHILRLVHRTACENR